VRTLRHVIVTDPWRHGHGSSRHGEVVAAKSSWVLEYSSFLSKICIWKLNYHLFACPIRKSWLILLSFIEVWICSQDMSEQHQSIGEINVFAYQRQGVFTVSVKSKNRNHNSWHGTRFDLWPLSCWEVCFCLIESMHFLHQKEIMIESSFWNINWNDVVCLCFNVRCELGVWVVLQLIPCSVERSYVHATGGMNKPFCILSTRRLVSPNPFGSQIPCRCWPTSQVWTRMGCTIPIKRRASKEKMREKTRRRLRKL